MGLAGRKQKQRIPADPRNLSWADDASRFGLAYLSKFGWDASKGLGSSGDGMKTHIKVQQKLDMMGIGAQHQQDPNGIAWKQNKEFEALLKRLNESAGHAEGADNENPGEDGMKVRETAMSGTFVRAQNAEADKKSEESSVTTKKRRHEGGNDSGSEESTRKQQRKDMDKKKRPKSNPGDAIHTPSSAPPAPEPHSEPIPKSRPMAHRARMRAAKRIAGKSASAIAEILGIAPSGSTSTPTSSPAPTPSSSSTPTPQPPLSLDNLTTSTKSVADYFKEKLNSRPSSSSSPASSALTSGSTTPGLGSTGPRPGLSSPDERRGIGSRTPTVTSQLPEAPSTSPATDDNAGDQDGMTEKRRRKEERKAKRQKRREAEASQAIPEGVSTVVEAGSEEHGVEGSQSIPTEDKRRKKRHERKSAGLDPPVN